MYDPPRRQHHSVFWLDLSQFFMKKKLYFAAWLQISMFPSVKSRLKNYVYVISRIYEPSYRIVPFSLLCNCFSCRCHSVVNREQFARNAVETKEMLNYGNS